MPNIRISPIAESSREPGRARDFIVCVDGVDVAKFSANYSSRGWRLYDIDGRPIRDPADKYTGPHIGVQCERRDNMESVVSALLEVGAPLTGEALEARRAAVAKFRAEYIEAQKRESRVWIESKFASALRLTLALTIKPGALPAPTLEGAQKLLATIQAECDASDARLDSEFADERSAANHGYRQKLNESRI